MRHLTQQGLKEELQDSLDELQELWDHVDEIELTPEDMRHIHRLNYKIKHINSILRNKHETRDLGS